MSAAPLWYGLEARTVRSGGDGDTGGSQFFMVLSEDNTRHLNGVHTVFGKISSGLDVMKQIKPNDVMNSVRVA